MTARLEPLVADSHAWRRLHGRRRLRRLARFLASIASTPSAAPDEALPQRAPGRVPRLQLAWLPYYEIHFSASTRRGTRDVYTLIDGFEGKQIRVVGEPPTRSDDKSDQPLAVPELPAHEAERTARLRTATAVARWAGWADRTTLADDATVTPVAYPYWAYYFHRRRAILDAKLLDALTGTPAGPATKVAFLAALRQTEQAD